MLISVFTALSLLQAGAVSGSPPTERVPPDCSSLSACLEWIDRSDAVMPVDETQIVVPAMMSFGQPARDALLDRMIDGGSYRAWQILRDADANWSPSDISRLLAAARRDPYSEALQLLAETGDPLAVSIVVSATLNQDARYYNVMRAASELFPAYWNEFLDGVERHLDEGHDFHGLDIPLDEAEIDSATLAALAAETAPDRRRNRRIAAMTILLGLRGPTEAIEENLVDASTDPDADIAELARRVLIHFGSAVYAREIAAEHCTPVADDFSPYGNPQGSLSDTCPYLYFSMSQDSIEAAGPVLLQLLNSDHPSQRREVAWTLTNALYDPAIPQFRRLLQSRDWRDVQAAIEALQAFADEGAIGQLRVLSQSHWHPAIQAIAENAANQIENPDPDSIPENLRTSYVGFLSYSFRPECVSRQWEWNGQHIPAFSRQSSFREDGENWGELRRLDLAGGFLLGSNRGEWLGELVWHPHGGEPEVLLADAVLEILPYQDGALVFTGLAHLGMNQGAVFRIEFGETQSPRVFRVAELPEAPYGGVARLEGRLFAVRSNSDRSEMNYVTVFDAEIGILGLADCVTD